MSRQIAKHMPTQCGSDTKDDCETASSCSCSLTSKI